jgi:hypothetical protein
LAMTVVVYPVSPPEVTCTVSSRACLLMGICINEEAETLRLRTCPVTRGVTAVTEEGDWARGSIRGFVHSSLHRCSVWGSEDGGEGGDLKNGIVSHQEAERYSNSLECAEERCVYWMVKVQTRFVEMCGCELPGGRENQEKREKRTWWKRKKTSLAVVKISQ